MTDIALAEHITTRSIDLYGDQPKDLQVEAVTSLVRGKHTFVRVGTGFGKTRISEMYFGLFDKKVVVLVLNPLDSLGDDQVREKKLVNINAINLNKMTLNMDTVNKIKRGAFSFVYLSPEVFLNSSIFTELFFSDEFQDILSLVVVDEAHMIYLWGLVVSKQSKSLIIFARLEDQAVFRPGYGHLGTRIMATNNIPVLLLSATCRPVAVSAITTSLMLQPSDINMINGELTRPEIRLIRIPMESTLSSCDDLLRIFAPASITSAADSVPMIIYSGTRNRTFQVMKVVNEARATPYHEYDPSDGFIRRFHSVTSDEDKVRVMDDFGSGKVPVISATMALGLGQNLKRVRCVVHMGRGDPAAIGQMVGRCGRDGNVGLGLLFMEPTRKNGRNALAEFGTGLDQDDDARMDALAVTNVCLRIAMNLDNKLGYIPLEPNDPKVLQERLREESLGFTKCKCSSCAPEEAMSLIKVIQQVTVSNFDSLLEAPSLVVKDSRIVTMTRKRRKNGHKGTCLYPRHVAEDLELHLLNSFEEFYYDYLGPRPEFPPAVFFGRAEAAAIVGSIDQIRAGGTTNLELLERVIGGQVFIGQIEALDGGLTEWTSGPVYQHHLRSVSELNRFIEAEGIRVREEMAAELLSLQAAAAARRQAGLDAKIRKKTESKAQAAAARTAARLLKAADQELERSRLRSEKAAYKACREEEKLARRKQEAECLAAAKAAAKAEREAQKAADRSSKLELQGAKMKTIPQTQKGKKMLKKTARQEQLALNLAGRKCRIEWNSEDTTMADGSTRDRLDWDRESHITTMDDEESMNKNTDMSPKDAEGCEGNQVVDRAGRLSKAGMVRWNNQAELVWPGPKSPRSWSHTGRHTHAKVQTRSQHNVAKIVRDSHTDPSVEALRLELARGA
ncbi:hypothetical protein PGTUg99_017459 [Puccinia graminis f. sp. tritici]|uniref:DNA 3'-5' helicase n=1 Tax=Puccinia graminis f. sp. tritici TaxID=56615 RepID=A0A5B0M3N2_PUCGR|nr:hypothetical protein PGTUg99_017459 [Puccinia graminis f. sp. tritici]